MTQTTGAGSFRKAAVDVGSATASLTELDSVGTAVRVSGGSRGSATANTFDGDEPILDGGKLAPIDVEVRFLYTESSLEGFEAVRALYEAEGGAAFFRFAPFDDSTSDNSLFSAANAARSEAKGVITEFLYPSGEAAGNEIIPGGFTLRCATLLKGSVVV